MQMYIPPGELHKDIMCELLRVTENNGNREIEKHA